MNVRECISINRASSVLGTMGYLIEIVLLSPNRFNIVSYISGVSNK